MQFSYPCLTYGPIPLGVSLVVIKLLSLKTMMTVQQDITCFG